MMNIADFGLVSCFQRFLDYLAFKFMTLNVPNEGYSRNASCALNSISKLLFFCLEYELIYQFLVILEVLLTVLMLLNSEMDWY
jgi:hypothetical protein